MSKSLSKRSIILELVITTVAILVVSHTLYRLRFIPAINQYISIIVAVMLLYIPIMMMWMRRREIDFIERGWQSLVKSLATFIIVTIIVFPVFFLIAHFWQIYVIGYSGFRPASFNQLTNIVLYQVFVVSLPEEFYFRGYFQSAMNRLMKPRWRILGVDLGWGWIITAAVFATAHTIIVYQWWHFAIFFPALLFGYLRERTGSIVAPTLFHALSNILMNWFARSYY